MDFRLFGLLQTQRYNPGHIFSLFASLKGKSQNSFLDFEFHTAPCGVPRLHPLVARLPPFCACAVLPMTMLLREWSQSHLCNLFMAKTLLWSPSADLTVSMLVVKVERVTIVVSFVGLMPQNYGSCVRHRNKFRLHF